jgi:hypothetical protein
MSTCSDVARSLTAECRRVHSISFASQYLTVQLSDTGTPLRSHCFLAAGTGASVARRLVLPDSFYSPRVASQRGSIRCVHEVRRGEKRCLSSLRLLTWR